MDYTTSVICISDRYDPGTNAQAYESVDDFLSMCDACFGEAPELIKHADGWRDAMDGELVLVSVKVPDGAESITVVEQ